MLKRIDINNYILKILTSDCTSIGVCLYKWYFVKLVIDLLLTGFLCWWCDVFYMEYCTKWGNVWKKKNQSLM